MQVLWKGWIAFGGVTVPVDLVAASGARGPTLRVLHDCGEPVRMVRTCPEHGQVPAEELRRGWEPAPDQLVVLAPTELKAIAPKNSREIAIEATVPTAELDALIIDRTYYLAPSSDRVALGAYAALAQTLSRGKRSALGRLYAWRAENVCAISGRRSEEGPKLLVLQTLLIPADIQSVGEVVAPLVGWNLKAGERERVRKAEEALARPYSDELLENRGRRRLEDLLTRKLQEPAKVRRPPKRRSAAKTRS